MSALRAVVWGLLSDEQMADPKVHQMLRRGVRQELSAHSLVLEACGQQSFRLLRPKSWNGTRLGNRRRRLCSGTFKVCCMHALKIIEPSNPQTAP